MSGEADGTDRLLIPKLAIEMGAAGTSSGRVPKRTRKGLQERSALFQALNHDHKRTWNAFPEKITFLQVLNATALRSRQ
jgi:hypothetical protein